MIVLRQEGSPYLRDPDWRALRRYIQHARGMQPLLAVRNLPATAEGSVQLDKGEELVELGQDKLIFGWKKLLLLLQDFKVTGTAGDVALSRDFDRSLVSLNGASLLNAGFGVFFSGDKCVGDFLESIEDRILVMESHLIAKCFGPSILANELAAVENRACEVRGDVPGIGAAGGKCGEFGADLAEECSETELRKEIGDGDTDLSVGGNQSLFGLADIWPTFE